MVIALPRQDTVCLCRLFSQLTERKVSANRGAALALRFASEEGALLERVWRNSLCLLQKQLGRKFHRATLQDSLTDCFCCLGAVYSLVDPAHVLEDAEEARGQQWDRSDMDHIGFDALNALLSSHDTFVASLGTGVTSTSGTSEAGLAEVRGTIALCEVAIAAKEHGSFLCDVCKSVQNCQQSHAAFKLQHFKLIE